MTTKPAQPYWNPYLAGVGLGLVLLTSITCITVLLAAGRLLPARGHA